MPRQRRDVADVAAHGAVLAVAIVVIQHHAIELTVVARTSAGAAVSAMVLSGGRFEEKEGMPIHVRTICDFRHRWVDYGTHGVVHIMASGTLPATWRATLAPPPTGAPTLEPQFSEQILERGVGNDWDHATGSWPDSAEWMPAEVTVATTPVGGQVHDIIVSSDGEHLYVARSDSVIVINGRQHIVASIPVAGPAKSLAIDAEGRQLFVINYDGSVLVIDTRDYTARTLWDGCASSVVVSPGGRDLYAAHGGVVSVIDIACATVVATVSVDDIAALAISPDGSRLYAVSYDRHAYNQYPAGWLTIIDTASYAVVKTIAIGACPETVTTSPDGTYVYVTHYETCSVSAVNLATDSIAAVALGDSPLGVVFSPDSAHAYVRNVHSVKVIDTTTNDANDIDAGDLPRGMRLSPDGKRAYVTNFGDSAVSVVDTITNSIATIVDVSDYPEVVAVSPDGERIYVGDYWSGAVAVISAPTLVDPHADPAS